MKKEPCSVLLPYNKEDWIKVGEPQDTYILTDEHCRDLLSSFGMYCHDMTGLKLRRL